MYAYDTFTLEVANATKEINHAAAEDETLLKSVCEEITDRISLYLNLPAEQEAKCFDRRLVRIAARIVSGIFTQTQANIEGDNVAEYKIEIVKIYPSCGNDTKNMMIKITDEKLIERTGGIVQGMSGSPIIQNGKIVGAVTHVLVNDPTRGYGIFIENMLDAAG